MVDYSTRALLRDLKVRAMLPENDGALSDDELMRLASVAYNTIISPFLRTVKEEYNVVQSVIPLSSGSFVGQFVKFPIPSRAEGGAVRNVYLRPQPTVGNNNFGQVQVPYIPPEDLGSTYAWNSSLATPYSTGLASMYSPFIGFTVENDDIVLVGNSQTVNNQLELLIKYYLRAGRFIAIDPPYNPFDYEQELQTAFQITSIDVTSSVDFWYLTGSAEVDTTRFPDASSVNVDIFGAAAPFRTRVVDAEATCENDFSNVILTFPKVSATSSYELRNTFFEYPAVNDWVTVTEELAVMKMPVELHEALIQASLVEIYKAMGDMAKTQEAQQALGMYLQAQRNLIAPRVQGSTRVILNTRSALRKGRQ